MDCERLDQLLPDLLYDELDELTTASAHRHRAQCSRCDTQVRRLQAVRTASVVPPAAPPPHLTERVEKVEREAQDDLPFRERLGRLISRLAEFAMRPQNAMAALLVLMLGSSLLVLRGQPGSHADMRVTESGIPESESRIVPLVASTPGQAPPSPEPPPEPSAEGAPIAEEKGAYGEGLALFRQGQWAAARDAFRTIAEQRGPRAPSASLMAAKAELALGGCRLAMDGLESVVQRYASASVGAEARWLAATCQAELGAPSAAREHLRVLRDVPGYAARAEERLRELSGTAAAPSSSVGGGGLEDAAPPRPLPAAVASDASPPPPLPAP